MSNAASLQKVAVKPQAAGNVAHAGLVLQRKCGCGSAKSLTGECADCKSEKRLQTKLIIGASSDPLEREADRVADQVMSAPGPSVTNGAPINIQRYAKQTSDEEDTVPPSVDRVLASSGNPLEPGLRNDMEQRFGHDFSRVRVHSGAAAEQSARDVDAHAYTVGNNIVFGGGQLSVATTEGRRLIAHELTHVVQQSQSSNKAAVVQRKGRGPGSCGLLGALTATVLGGAAHVQIQTRLAGRGFAVEMPIPRATKTAGVGSRKCQDLGTSWGFADVAQIIRPIVGISEIKPFGIAGIVGRFEAMHYRTRSEQSKQRLTGVGRCGKKGAGLDDTAFNVQVGPLSAASSFTLLKGAIAGTEDFGPFTLDPTRNLHGKEVTAGAIGYWCKLNDEGKKKKKEEEEKKKKEKEEKKKKKQEERERKKKERQERAKKRAEKRKGKQPKGKPEEMPKEKPKPEPKKPKDKPKKPKEPPKPKASASAGNVGFGISIFSSSVGGANAGVGISVGSDSAAVGTAGAGISWFSDSAAAGAAGAGVAVDSDSAAAGAVGVGISEDSESVAVGAAGVGESKGSITAGVGVAGAGKVEDSQVAGAGAAGTGEVKGSTTATAGSVGSGKQEGVTGAGTGSPKEPIDPKDVTGPDAEKVPEGQGDAEVAPGKYGKPGQTEPASGDTPSPKGDAEAGGAVEGQQQTAGEGAAQDKGTGDKKEGGEAAGATPGGTAPREQQGTGGKGTGTDAGTPGTTATPSTGTGTGSGKVDLGVLPVFPFGASDADREKVAAEAAKVALMLDKASEAQKLLLHHLANKEQTGQYLVPASEWVNKLLRVTEGLTPEEIEVIKNLDWKPGSISEEELRKRLKKALEDRNKPPATGDGDKKPDGGKTKAEGGSGEGKGTGDQAGKGTGDQAGKTTGDKGAGQSGGAEPAPAAGVRDRATAPPAGYDRTTAGVFGFNVRSGLTASSTPNKGDVILVSLTIDDKGKKFPLDDVSITFDSRVETVTVAPDGTEQTEITMNFFFTNDFWSQANQFLGKGGEESLTNIKFFIRKKKQ